MTPSRHMGTTPFERESAASSMPPAAALGAPDYRLLFEQLPGACLVLSPSLVVLTATDDYLAATMTVRDEIVGRCIFDVFPANPDDPASTSQVNLRRSLQRVVDERVADTMAVQKYDIPRPEEQGGGFEERYWSPVNSPVFDRQGRLAYIVHRAEDVTAYVLEQQAHSRDRAAAAQLHVRTQSMEREIVERSQELQAANDDLRRLAQLLRRADERGRFLAMTSHELRTPLTSITGFATTLRTHWEELSEQQRLQFVTIVESQADRLGRLVNDLLLLSQVESGKLPVEPRPTDIGELIAGVLHELDMTAQVDCPDGLVAQVDADRVRQILSNLLTNARKYGRPPVVVTARDRSSSIVLTVADHGPGVSESFRDRMFLEFAREAGAGEAEEGHGVGLGLSIVRRIAYAHGGFVRYEREGGVTTMRVRLKAPPPTA